MHKAFIRSSGERISRALSIWLVAAGSLLGACLAAETSSNALENYVRKPDSFYNWKRTHQQKFENGTFTFLEQVSQRWRDQFWSHQIVIAKPSELRHRQFCYIWITGDRVSDRELELIRTISTRAGALAAVLTKVPNQPLYDGKTEDALIAFTFDQYMKTGDESWPALFPMVKSAVRAMDTIQAFAKKEFSQDIDSFVVGGGSKRGWTTWLTAAVEPRVKAITPAVIDMLNMKTQLNWAEKMYGRQSEQIADYTQLNLHLRTDEPEMVKLRSWVDPYSHRNRYTMPKLILLGTNDPYWVVDALRHYWDELPGPKLVFQTPNAGHDLAGGKEAVPVIAAFYQMVVDAEPLPKVDWKIEQGEQGAKISLHANVPAKSIRLWTADSADRDFRNDKWTSRDLEVQSGSSHASATVSKPEKGYRAFLAEIQGQTARGNPYKFSTEARVTPDTAPVR